MNLEWKTGQVEKRRWPDWDKMQDLGWTGKKKEGVWDDGGEEGVARLETRELGSGRWVILDEKRRGEKFVEVMELGLADQADRKEERELEWAGQVEGSWIRLGEMEEG